MAKSHPDFGAQLIELEAHAFSPEDGKSQIETLTDWEKRADSPQARRYLQRLLTDRRWRMGESVVLPFDGAHWNLGDMEVGKAGLLQLAPTSRTIAHIPLSVSEKGLSFEFDLDCRPTAASISLKLISPFRFEQPISDLYANSFFFLEKGTLSAPLPLFSVPGKGGRPNGWYMGAAVQAAKVPANAKAHVRLEYWNNYQLVWIDQRLAGCFARVPDETLTTQSLQGDRFLALEVAQFGGPPPAKQWPGISPIRITAIDASPRSWLPDHFESVGRPSYALPDKKLDSALPLDPAAEIPDPLPWAQAALLRDPGHEACLPC